MSNPLISIIIPVYGVEEYIARCARSVFEQTYQNLEIIFVDDCTPDNSIGVLKDVMEEYLERKAQVKIVKHEHNRGLSAARNTGMDAATGEYIYFLDSDDAITEDCIEILVKPMEEKHWDMVTADYKEEGSSKVLLRDAEYRDKDILKSFSVGWHWNAWNKLFDRNYLQKYDFRFVDGIYFEDVPFTFKVACTASAIKVIGKETYIYVNRPTSIMNVHKTDKYISSYKQVAEEMRRVQKQYKAFSYDAEKWINVMEDKVEQLVTSEAKSPHQLVIAGSEATTTEHSEKNGSAIADRSVSCHTTSIGSCQKQSDTCGTSGTAAGVKVSIIVPVYNVEKYIERCARCVFEQTYSNLEIIFVDDCTPDNSIGVLKQVMEEYPERKAQVKILKHDHNRGLSAVRNTGMDAATGEYIYFLDSDDAITEDCIEALVKPLEKQKYDFVIGNVRLVDFPNPEKIPHLTAEERPVIGNDNILAAYNDARWYSMAWNKLARRKYLVDNELYFKEGLIHEDELWSYQLSVTAKSMYVVRKDTYIYYNRPGSIMTTQRKEREVESFKTIVEEARKTQQRLQLFSYNSNYKIDCFQDLLLKKMRRAGQGSLRSWYKVIRRLDLRSVIQKWQCYHRPIRLLPFNFHYFLPAPVGYLWHKWYGFWRM